MKTKVRVALLVLCGALACAAQTENASQRHITMHDAVELAIQHNHLLRINQAKVEESRRGNADSSAKCRHQSGWTQSDEQRHPAHATSNDAAQDQVCQRDCTSGAERLA